MFAYEHIQKAYKSAEVLPIDKNSKLVMISDCHRGIGSGADDFSKNQNLYHAAIKHYIREGFTYIELGDGDELWENRHFCMIAEEYKQIFALLSLLHKSGRLYMIYGNHDMDKKNSAWVARYLEGNLEAGRTVCAEPHEMSDVAISASNGPLFPGIKIHEGLVLRHSPSGCNILLIHGHQADFFNFRLWRLARFMVRYLWRPLELIGVHNPFDTPSRPGRRDMVEKYLLDWCRREDTMLIAGHTHRASFPKDGEPPYYNTGSCVHRRHITCLEIENDFISLVKWSIQPRQDNVLYIKRDIIKSGLTISCKL